MVLYYLQYKSFSQRTSKEENLFKRNFQSAVALTVDPSGNIFVLDGGTSEVFKYSSDGKLLHKIGGHGWSNDSFDQPSDIFTSNGLDFYVADYGNHRIQRFDRNLNYVSTLSLRDEENQNMRFGYPKSIAVDRFGALYLLDGENIRIMKLKGNIVEKVFGGIDAGKGRLENPKKIRVSDDDKVYVLDAHSIVVFDIYGNFIQAYPETMFDDIRAIALFSDGLALLDSCQFKFIGLKKIDNSFADTSQGKLCEVNDFVFRQNKAFLLTKNRFFELPFEQVIKENEK